MEKKNKCIECGNNHNSEYNQYFDKVICYYCEDKYCSNCQRKLQFNDDDKKKYIDIYGTFEDDKFTKKCYLCGNFSCYECFSSDCDICYKDYRCSMCCGNTIILCNELVCCVECLLFKNDNKINLKYCKKHKNFCLDEEVGENDEEKLGEEHREEIVEDNYNCEFSDEPNMIKFIEEKKDNFSPPLSKYTLWSINNIGYRGIHFM